MSGRYHIYPVNSKNQSDHWTGKKGFCWCDAEEMQVCPESDEAGKCIESCFKCSGSGIVKPYDETLNYLIIHKEGQLDKYLKEIK